MAFLLNDTPIQSADLTVERLGVWEGRVAVAGELDLAEGAAVTLTLGDQDFAGHVVAGGPFPGSGETTYELAGGGTGWAKAVPKKWYQVPQGVTLAMVAAELAADSGEKIDTGGTTVILGDHWTRPAGPGSAALSTLYPLEAGGWRVDPDGVTRPGPRPLAPVPASVRFAVEDQRRAERWARLGLPDDTVSAFLPGAVFTAENLAAPIVVATTTIRATPESVLVEVRGEGGLVEMLTALIQALTPSRIFNGLWTYQVADVDSGRPNLKALATAPGLPDTLACDKVPGAPGVTSTLASGALILVGFRDGHPGRPFVAGYLPGVLPVSLTLDASGDISLGAGGTALALAAKVDTQHEILRLAINSLGGALPVLATTGAVKAKGV